MTTSSAPATDVTLESLLRSPAVGAEEVERLLRHPSPALREPARRIGAAVLPTEVLVAWLRDGSDDVLRNAGLEMLRARGAEAVGLALELLGDPDGDVVLQAVLLLDHFRPARARDRLRGLLRHENPNVVQAVLVTLGHLGDPAVVPDLLPFLSSGPWLAMAAVQALGELGEDAAVTPLSALLGDELLGDFAAEALARIGGPEAFRLLATRWLAHPAESDALLARLADAAEALATAVVPCGALALALRERVRKGGKAGLDAGRCLLASGPSDADEAALEVLQTELSEQVGGGGGIPACLRRRSDLIGLLLHAEGASRKWGYRLAAQSPDQAPVGALVAALSGFRGHEYVDAIAEALFAVSDPRLGAVLIDVYGRLPRDIRMTWGLLLHRHRAGIRSGLAGRDCPADVREVLATIVEEDPVRAATLISGTGPAVRMEALAHATQRGDVLRLLPWPTWLDADPDAYGAIAVSVAERAELAADLPVLRAMTKRRPHKELVRLLGRLRDPVSVPLLADIAFNGATALRPFALTALGAIGGADARSVLRRAVGLDMPAPWARFACRALADCHAGEDLPLFRETATHLDWHVRMISAEVLCRAGLDEDQGRLEALAADPVAAVAQRTRELCGR